VERETGTVKWFSNDKGYGFISRDGGGDIFVHHSGIEGSGFRTLLEGQRVEFGVSDETRGLRAVDIKVIAGSSSPEGVPSLGSVPVGAVRRESESMSKRLRVSNLSPSTSESRLRELFEAVGEVASLDMVVESIGDQRRGLGVVEMAEEDAARQAVSELDGEEMDGFRIEVSQARAS
jgi:CspA family cold shock protein